MSSVIKTKIIVTLILFLSILFFSVVSQAVNITDIAHPKYTNGTWVVDTANILSENTETQLNQIINNLEAENGIEIAVVTVSNTKSATSPQELTTKLYDTWELGKPEKNNGILFLVSASDRHAEITIGLDLKNILSDARVARIIQAHVTPRFKQQDFNGGVLNGTKVMVGFLQKVESDSPQLQTKQSIINLLTNQVLPIIFGIIGSLYYYYLARKAALLKKDSIVLKPTGFSRNKLSATYYDFSLNFFLVYSLICICCFFASFFVFIPILSIATPLLILGLLTLNIFWAIQVKQNSFYQSGDYIFLIVLLMITSPIILISALTSSAFFVVIPLVCLAVYSWHQEKNKESEGDEDDLNNYLVMDDEEKQKSIFSLVSMIVANIILSVTILFTGSWLLKNYSFSYNSGMIFWSLEASIPTIYLTWESYQKKHLMNCYSEAECADCQKSLNRIDSRTLKQYLKSPENIAQKLKNVSYQGWYCSHCIQDQETNNETTLERSQIHLIAHIAKYLKLPECPTCKELTITHKSKIINRATKDKKGLMLSTYTCQCCKYSYAEEKIIPPKPFLWRINKYLN